MNLSKSNQNSCRVCAVSSGSSCTVGDTGVHNKTVPSIAVTATVAAVTPVTTTTSTTLTVFFESACQSEDENKDDQRFSNI